MDYGNEKWVCTSFDVVPVFCIRDMEQRKKTIYLFEQCEKNKKEIATVQITPEPLRPLLMKIASPWPRSPSTTTYSHGQHSE